ncbi:putative G-patch domain protein [Xylaria bambusicola]|uniref:putative G-patch domain protein n=1 Tax=Xylaria bambusicola TaxID=326684 RepID=UPI0020082703|nr:putative G-patch domain protein [Xylaria bambusicola]KAI0508371.1 putative G-patch domain protein [Xylaria bambusicola]
MAPDEDDDYMNMTFEECPTTIETSLQRRQRLKREGEIKGRVKSKVELAAEEREARETALSRNMLEGTQAKKSKGLAMMAKMGFKGGALGRKENPDARLEPIRPEMKDDRAGIGLDSERKRKLREAAESTEKKVKVDEAEYRDRVRREREAVRYERMAYAAMNTCERMDEKKRQSDTPTTGVAANSDIEKKRILSTRPLKSIPVVWRGLIRKREEVERDRRMKHDLQQTSAPRLPAYEDDLEDEDDRKAMGKTQTAYAVVEDLDEEDPELDEFNAHEPDVRLQRIVEHLRAEYHYCFWCKFEYPDDTMEGCPGPTEDDHD